MFQLPLFDFFRPKKSPPTRAQARPAYTLQVAEYAVLVQPKPIRTLRLNVRADGTVTVSAPLREPQGSIREFVGKHLDWVAKRKSQLAQAATLPRPQLTPAEKRRLAKELIDAAQAQLPRWREAMGSPPVTLRVRDMRTRWGTCNPRTGVVTLALELARRDKAALEFILVHELAHFKVRRHGARFKAIMDKHLPDWRTRSKAMRGMGE